MSFKANIHNLKSGKYQVDYILPYTRRRRRHRYDSYEEALEAMKVAEMRFNPMRRKEYANHAIEQLMEMHIKECPNSRIDERLIVKALFLKEFGDWRLADLNKVELERWLRRVALERGLSFKTVRHWVVNLNYFFDYLVDLEVISVSPLRLIRFPSQSSIPIVRPRVILSKEEIREILDVSKICSPNYFFPLFLLATHTGARKQELTKLKWENVDFQRQTIMFRKTKNASDREIKMPTEVMEYLKSAPRRSPYVLTCEEGLPIGLSQMNWRLERFKKNFPNGKNWTLHSFRHSFAHQFLKNGGQMYQLQAILGHKGIEVTLRVYGQIQAVEIENPSPYRF